MKRLLITVVLLFAGATQAAADFTIQFSWNDIPLCTSGRPNTVGNPAFLLRGVPAGTQQIEFRMVDLDAPSYNHGGAILGIRGDGTVPEGIFTYRSPCPPSGSHTYEWRATARGGGAVLGEARAQRQYPE